MKAKITDEEGFWLKIMRLNRVLGTEEIRKSFEIGRLKVAFHWRSKDNLWGRFGGGWQWKLGVQGSGRTWIFSLLIFEVTVSWRKVTS